MQLIESKTLATAQVIIQFTSIPQNFTDLLVLISARSTRAGGNVVEDITLVVNAITSGYSGIGLQGFGSGAGSFTDDTAANKFRYLSIINAADSTSNTFSNSTIYIPNYAGSTTKSFSFDNVVEHNGTAAIQRICTGLLANTAPITSLTFDADNGDLVAGSTISLYGIIKGSDGITTVS